MHRKTTLLSLVTLSSLVFFGCPAKSTSGLDGGSQPGVDMGIPPGPPPPPPPPGPPPPPPPPPTDYPESTKANVKFKANERLANDLAQALSLPVGQVCTELGQYSCTNLVHRVSLGGVEPYTLNLNEPLPSTTITTPIAVERVALFACQQRADLDLQDPAGAVIFKNLPVQDGAISNINAPEIAAAIDALYKRALQRVATQEEAAHLLGFYQELVDTGEPNPARAWATLSCFSVLTTMESLFY